MHNTFSEQSLNYTWCQLAERVGILNISSSIGNAFESIGLKVFYENPHQSTYDQQSIIVFPCGKDAWRQILKRPSRSVDWIQCRKTIPEGAILPFNKNVPVLFWGEGCEDGSKPFVEQRPDGSVVFYADIIAATLFMLTRWEETVVATRDEHDRFPAIASVAYKQDFLDRPIIDEYALILREWLKVLLPGWLPQSRQFSVKVSHDIDLIKRFPNWSVALRNLAGDLLKRRNLSMAINTLHEIKTQVFAPEHTEYMQGIKLLAKWSLDAGLGNDAYYFMTDGPGPYNEGYNILTPEIIDCIGKLREQGFEIGFHPGYDTFLNLQRLAKEKDTLREVLFSESFGCRQHYLRFQVPDTWHHQEQVGLEYDSTMGYADMEGFRCGTCHPFQPFDVEQDRELNLVEYPLIVMDATLMNYRRLEPEQAGRRILELAAECKKVEGLFTLLWHNTSLYGEWGPWVGMYQRILYELGDMMHRNSK
jgi:hypothetical protein